MRTGSGIAALAAISLVMNGCAGDGAGFLGVGAMTGDRNLAGAEPLFSHEEEACMGTADRLMATLFAPISKPEDDTAFTKPKRKRDVKDKDCARIRQNFLFFLPVPAKADAPRYNELQRNEIIDALIATSNRKCTRYVELLKNADGAMNAGLSVGAIIAGGTGSIVKDPGTARLLAGLSAILGGSRAALNDTYLSNQTIHVLALAFEKARRDQRRVITNRQACPVAQYTLMRGVEDAFSYHQSCSLVAGLAETALSIERSENPGFDTMRMQMNEILNLRRQAAEFATEGPITPIAAMNTPPSLDKLVAADKALTDAQTTLGEAVKAEKQAIEALDSARLALANQSADDKSAEIAAVAARADDLKKASDKVKVLTTARDQAAKTRDAEVHALVRVTTVPKQASPDPETRACPFT